MSFPLVSLGDLVKIARNGITPEKIQSGTNYVGLENIDGSGNFIDVKGVDAGELASSKFLFTKKQVLFGKLRPYLKKIARPNFDGICSTDILPLLPSKEIDRDYLFHTLRRQSFVDDASSLSSGANLPRISPKVLSEMQIPLPSLEEQRRIATILDKADALRAQRRAAIGKLDELLQSVFIDFFGDPVVNPKGWPIVKVGDVFTDFVGGKNVECPDSSSSPYRILKVSSVTSKVYLPEESKPAPENFIPTSESIVEKGDLLFSRANTTSLVAATAYVWDTPENMVLPDKLWKMRVAHANVEIMYLWELFKNENFRRELSKLSSGTSGSMKNIAKSKLVLLNMPLPPQSLQQRFSQIAEKIEAQKRTMQCAAEKSDALFSSLQQRAFSGKL